MTLTTNCVVGGVTIYTERIEQTFVKTLTIINPPKGTKEQEADPGPKPSIILDLSRIERRWTITGTIDVGDESALENVFLNNRMFSATIKGTVFTVNSDKLSITTIEREDDHLEVTITLVDGTDAIQT